MRREGSVLRGTLQALGGRGEREWGREGGISAALSTPDKMAGCVMRRIPPCQSQPVRGECPQRLAVLPQRAGQGPRAANGKCGAPHTSPQGQWNGRCAISLSRHGGHGTQHVPPPNPCAPTSVFLPLLPPLFFRRGSLFRSLFCPVCLLHPCK